MGLQAGELRGVDFPVEGSVAGEVLRTGKAVVLSDARADQRSAQPIIAAGAGPAAFVPLSAQGRVFGTLTVANGRRRPAVPGE